jgi:hypothetical protein
MPPIVEQAPKPEATVMGTRNSDTSITMMSALLDAFFCVV